MKRGRNDEIRGDRKEVGGFCQFRTEHSQQEHNIDRSKWVSRPDRVSGHGGRTRRRVAGENVTGGRTLFREAERGALRERRRLFRTGSQIGRLAARAQVASVVRSVVNLFALAPLPLFSFGSSSFFAFSSLFRRASAAVAANVALKS